jgi:hypothetical protein
MLIKMQTGLSRTDQVDNETEEKLGENNEEN